MPFSQLRPGYYPLARYTDDTIEAGTSRKERSVNGEAAQAAKTDSANAARLDGSQKRRTFVEALLCSANRGSPPQCRTIALGIYVLFDTTQKYLSAITLAPC